MALQVSGTRKFHMKKGTEVIVLEDPNLNMSPQEVMDFYANHHAELLNGEIKGPELGDNETIVYHFSFTAKTKG